MLYEKESHAEKTMRVAKREAYGACDLHKGHEWDTGTKVFAMTGLCCLVLSADTYSVMNDKLISAKAETSNAQQTIQTYSQEVQSMSQNQPKGVKFTCKGKDGKDYNGVAPVSLNLAEAELAKIKTCVFEVAK